MVLSIVLVLGMIIGPSDAMPTRRVIGAAAAGAYVLIVLANFYYLYPVLAGDVIPYASWHARMWFNSWI
jgi:dolichyl-phosphate-mannose--protein O-mannosyl transferase